MDNRDPELKAQKDSQPVLNSSSKSYNVLTETESENDEGLTLSIAKQKDLLESHKSKGADAGKKKNKTKRTIVGFFIASLGFLSALLGASYIVISLLVVVTLFHKEVISIGRNE